MRTFLLLLSLSLLLPAMTPDNFAGYRGKPLIIPQPQETRWAGTTVSLRRPLEVRGSWTTRTERKMAEELLAKVRKRFCLSGKETGEKYPVILELTEKEVPSSAEGYCLLIGKKELRIQAKGRAGLFYGIRTLENLLANATAPELPCGVIQDYPALEHRGIYIVVRFLKHEDMPAFLNFLRALSTLKINTLYLEFDENLPFEKTPFTKRREPVLTKADIELLRKTAENYHQEIVPTIQVATHDSWMRAHPLYLEKMAASRKASRLQDWGTCYCPVQPLSRQVTEYVIDNTIRLLKPKRFNLCMDEFLVSRWGDRCDQCGKPHTQQQMAEEINHYCNLLLKRKITPMICHDSIYPQQRDVAWNSATPQIVRNLPKGTSVIVWDYGANIDKKRINFFQENGVQTVIGAGFCDTLENLMEFPRVLSEKSLPEFYLTYWGYVNSPFVKPERITPRSAAGTVLAANYAWHPLGEPLPQIGWDPAREFRRRMEEPFDFRRGKGENRRVDISAQMNAELGESPNFPLLDHKKIDALQIAMKACPENFQLRRTDKGLLGAAVVMNGKSAAPLCIPVKSKCLSICFVATLGTPRDVARFGGLREHIASPVVNMVVKYKDGTSVQKCLCYHRQITDWNSRCSGYDTRFVWQGTDQRGALISLCACDWENPHPEKEIAALEFVPEKKNEAPFALFALNVRVPVGTPPAAEQENTPVKIAAPLNLNSELNGGFEECAHFVDGQKGGSKFSAENRKTVSPVTWKFVTDERNPGKQILEVTIPPLKSQNDRERVFIDVPLQKREKIGGVRLEYSVSNMKLLHTGLYLMNGSKSIYRVNYDFHRSAVAGAWNTKAIPITVFRHDGSGRMKDSEIAWARISFWFRKYNEPIVLRIAAFGISEENIGLQRPLYKQALP